MVVLVVLRIRGIAMDVDKVEMQGELPLAKGTHVPLTGRSHLPIRALTVLSNPQPTTASDLLALPITHGRRTIGHNDRHNMTALNSSQPRNRDDSVRRVGASFVLKLAT
jgi:hypothetical protein